MALKMDSKKVAHVLKMLSPHDLLNTTDLAHLFNMHPSSIRRNLYLKQLPKPDVVKNARKCWTAKCLRDFLRESYQLEI